MAKRLDDDNLYVFDEDHVSGSQKISNSSMFDSILSFVTSRYFVLGTIFCVFGVLILIMTASLQFSDEAKKISASTVGVARQYIVPAPRGDIVDSKGRVIATNQEINTLMLSNAGLDDTALNSMCLELSYLFDKYNCVPVSTLDDYFSIDPYAFQKSDEDIALWQTNRNLFDLKEPNPNTVVTYSDEYVKSDPQIFFLYLRRKFHLDENYTEQEAYRIIKIRYQIYMDNWAFQTGTPVLIAKDVPEELIRILMEQNYHFMGILANKEYRRVYTPLAKVSSHVVGYVGKISQEKLSELQPVGYMASDLVGQSGVEAQMERYLHGQYGEKPYNVWSTDQENGIFYDSSLGVDPRSGAQITLTIDTNLQQVGIDSIKEYIQKAIQKEESKPIEEQKKTASAGSLVVMKVKTGEILAMCSYPDYDPNDFVLSMEGDVQAKEQVKYYLGIDEYQDITKEDMPLWNRAISSMYPPGSTFKLVTALTALECKVISPENSEVRCVSPTDFGGMKWTCLEYPETGHGMLDLTSGLATSCNIYFASIGVDSTISNIDKTAQRLGLGELTGIDLPGEYPGIRANQANKRRLRSNWTDEDTDWHIADTAQAAIGQFDNCFTVIQLARYVAAIATNTLVTPHVIDKVTAADGSILYEGPKEAIPLQIDEDYLEAIHRGMLAASTEGTGQEWLSNFPITVACKTGTAETGFEDINMEYSNGVFICYAPAENPEICIALCIERGEWGSRVIEIARKLLIAYFNEKDPNKSEPEKTLPPIGDVIEDSQAGQNGTTNDDQNGGSDNTDN